MNSIKITLIFLLLLSFNCLHCQVINEEEYTVVFKNGEVINLKYKDIKGDTIYFVHEIFGTLSYHKNQIKKITKLSSGLEDEYYKLIHSQNYLMDTGIMPEGGTWKLRSDFLVINRIGYSFSDYLSAEAGFMILPDEGFNLLGGLKIGHSVTPYLHLAMKVNSILGDEIEGFYIVSPIATIGSSKNNLTLSYNFTRIKEYEPLLFRSVYKNYNYISLGGCYTISKSFSIRFENLNFNNNPYDISTFGFNWNNNFVSLSLGFGIVNDNSDGYNESNIIPTISGVFPLYTPGKKFD